MSSILTPQKTDSWVVEMPLEMTQALGVSEGSLAVLHAKLHEFRKPIACKSRNTGVALSPLPQTSRQDTLSPERAKSEDLSLPDYYKSKHGTASNATLLL